ncbi:MAG: hypothetical protein U0Q19_14345 [Kineosporiaceae bacterium]
METQIATNHALSTALARERAANAQRAQRAHQFGRLARARRRAARAERRAHTAAERLALLESALQD